MSLINFRPFVHTGAEYRELADELWERGFKDVSSIIHDMARVQENHEKIAKGIKDSNEIKEQAR